MKKFTVRPRITTKRQILIGGQDEGTEHVFLGQLAEAGQLVRVDYDLSNPHVVAIFGKRGSGKSYTLGSFIEGLCTQEKETTIAVNYKSHAVLLFDTLGIFQWSDVPLSKGSSNKIINEQLSAQKGWDIKSEPLNVQIWVPKGTTSSSNDHLEFAIDCSDFAPSDWGYLLGVDIIQDRVGQLLNDAYEKVVNEGWSDGQNNYLHKKRYAIEDLIHCVQKDTELLTSYHPETRRALLQQLNVYWRNPLFQPKHTDPDLIKVAAEKNEISFQNTDSKNLLGGTSLTSLLKEGCLSVLLLHKLPDEMRFIIIISLIRKIMQARIEISELEKNLKIRGLSGEEKIKAEEKIKQGVPPTWIVADEAQNFLPSERRTGASEVLIRLVREGRNFGLSFMLTTQQPSAIDQRILAQVDTMIVHKLTIQSDVECIKRNLKSGLPEEVKFANSELSFEGLIRALDLGQALVSNTEADRAFIMDVRPRVSVHGGFGS